MAFLRRKLSPDCTGGGDHDEYCFPNSPPPILPPAANPGAAEEFVRLTNQSPANRLNRSRLIPICASLLAFVVILFTYYVACRWYPALLRRRRRRSAFVVPPDLPALLELPAPVEDDGDLRRDLLAGDGGGEPYHVWFIRTKGLDEQTIGAISVCPYRRSEGLVEGTDCSICLGEFTEGETLRLLPKCNHAFHLLCIDTWLRSRVNCPLCRAPILASSPPPAPIDPEPAGAIGTPEEQGSGRGEDSAPEEAVVALEGSSSSGGESEVWVTIELAEQADDRAQGVKLEPLRRSVSVDSGVCFLSRIAGRPRAL